MECYTDNFNINYFSLIQVVSEDIFDQDWLDNQSIKIQFTTALSYQKRGGITPLKDLLRAKIKCWNWPQSLDDFIDKINVAANNQLQRLGVPFAAFNDFSLIIENKDLYSIFSLLNKDGSALIPKTVLASGNIELFNPNQYHIASFSRLLDLDTEAAINKITHSFESVGKEVTNEQVLKFSSTLYYIFLYLETTKLAARGGVSSLEINHPQDHQLSTNLIFNLEGFSSVQNRTAIYKEVNRILSEDESGLFEDMKVSEDFPGSLVGIKAIPAGGVEGKVELSCCYYVCAVIAWIFKAVIFCGSSAPFPQMSSTQRILTVDELCALDD